MNAKEGLLRGQFFELNTEIKCKNMDEIRGTIDGIIFNILKCFETKEFGNFSEYMTTLINALRDFNALCAISGIDKDEFFSINGVNEMIVSIFSFLKIDFDSILSKPDDEKAIILQNYQNSLKVYSWISSFTKDDVFKPNRLFNIFVKHLFIDELRQNLSIFMDILIILNNTIESESLYPDKFIVFSGKTFHNFIIIYEKSFFISSRISDSFSQLIYRISGIDPSLFKEEMIPNIFKTCFYNTYTTVCHVKILINIIRFSGLRFTSPRIIFDISNDIISFYDRSYISQDKTYIEDYKYLIILMYECTKLVNSRCMNISSFVSNLNYFCYIVYNLYSIVIQYESDLVDISDLLDVIVEANIPEFFDILFSSFIRYDVFTEKILHLLENTAYKTRNSCINLITLMIRVQNFSEVIIDFILANNKLPFIISLFQSDDKTLSSNTLEFIDNILFAARRSSTTRYENLCFSLCGCDLTDVIIKLKYTDNQLMLKCDRILSCLMNEE